MSTCDKCNNNDGDYYTFYVVSEDTTLPSETVYSLAGSVESTICRTCVTKLRLFYGIIAALTLAASVILFTMVGTYRIHIEDDNFIFGRVVSIFGGIVALVFVVLALGSREKKAKRLITKLQKKQLGLGGKKNQHALGRDIDKKLYTKEEVDEKFDINVV